MTVTTEFKQTKIGPIPVDWDEVKLNDVLIIGHGKDQKQVICEGGKYPILGTGGCIGYTNDFLYDKESVLIGRKGTIDKPQYMTTPFWTVDTLFYTKIKDNAIPKYIYYLFQSIDWYKHNEATGVPSLSSKNIINIQASLPPLPEQKKIAEVLSTVDDKIDSIEQEVDQIRTLKKGLMQKLLTGQLSVTGTPHTFKDSKLGPIPEAWEVVNVADTGSIITGNTPSTTNRDYYEGSYLFVSPADLGNTKIINTTNKTLTEAGFKQTRVIPRGSAMVTCIGSTIGKMGVAGIDLATNQQINSVSVNDDNDSEFIYYSLLSRAGHIKGLAGIHAVPIVNKSLFSGVEIITPPLPEQKKIAEMLGGVDEKLDILNEKKGKYTTLKKGLMQKLLTGKMRMG